MITKMRRVHYCEFCGKHRLRSDSMERHERHCTMNPNRQCRMCGSAEYLQLSMTELNEILEKYDPEFETFDCCRPDGTHYTRESTYKTIADEKGFFAEVERRADGVCPICMYALSRQSKIDFKDFDWKKESESLLREINSHESEGIVYYW